jgi:hypothetical protein
MCNVKKNVTAMRRGIYGTMEDSVVILAIGPRFSGIY